jgi:hypothetical protein
MKWRVALTVRFDVTPVRAEVSLAVTQGHVVAVHVLCEGYSSRTGYPPNNRAQNPLPRSALSSSRWVRNSSSSLSARSCSRSRDSRSVDSVTAVSSGRPSKRPSSRFNSSYPTFVLAGLSEAPGGISGPPLFYPRMYDVLRYTPAVRFRFAPPFQVPGKQHLAYPRLAHPQDASGLSCGVEISLH